DLPEVKDIPGQENVKPLRFGELADNTASSADEEGDDVLEQDKDDLGIVMGNDADVTPAERAALAGRPGLELDSPDDESLIESSLDSTDEDGTPLNEKSSGRDLVGDDLDVPGSEEDDDDEEIGEEDEENNDYSLSDNSDNDEVEE
ncbi:MAG TPA: hypothetical protein VNU72_07420, partial [Puia sp.]|nr:hypothetical protein [Puia sp.]